MPPFVHQDKSPGDLIRSADWNLVGNEVVRLGADKISRAGEESLEGPLTVRGTLNVAGTAANGVGLSLKGELTVGTPTAGAAVRILRRQEDGKAATDGALVLGTDSASSGALRMGYYSTYSWLQGQGQQAIALNPHGGNVGIGTGATAPTAKLHVAGDALLTGYLYFGNRSTLTPDQGGSLELGGDNGTAGKGTPYIDFHFGNTKVEDYNVRLINDGDRRLTLAGSLQVTGNVGVGVDVPVSRLAVAGGASVGAGYAATAAPGDGLIVQGNVGIGVAAPANKLHVNGDTVWTDKIGQRFILHTRQNAAGDFLQLTVDNAKGEWEWGKGITLLRATGSVGIGTNQPSTEARLHVAGGALRLDANQEIVFADNGQIRSADNSHRILFRRSEDKMELREYGDIIFSPGSRGSETALAVLTAGGQLSIGNKAPPGGHPLYVEGGEVHSGGAAGGYSFANRGSAYVPGGGNGDRWVLYSHDRTARLWSGGDKLTVATDGTLTAGAFRFGNGSLLKADQGGSIELGADNGGTGTGTPYIDFHFKGKTQDYNARIINDGDGQLTVSAGTFAVRDCFAVSLACADFLIGHRDRHKTPGRALVDDTTILHLNYGTDWSGGVTYWGALNKQSTRDIKEDILGLDAPRAASLLRGLEPVRYRLIGDESRAEHLGFVAEDVPDAIAGPGHRSINESHIVAVLTRVVKEQQRRLDELTHRLEEGRSHG